jgi:hypothetical protein
MLEITTFHPETPISQSIVFGDSFGGGHTKDPKGKEGGNVFISSARWLRGWRPAWQKNEEILGKKFPKF